MGLAKGELHERQAAALGDGVRQAFSECLEVELEALVTRSLLLANEQGPERVLKREHADHAAERM